MDKDISLLIQRQWSTRGFRSFDSPVVVTITCRTMSSPRSKFLLTASVFDLLSMAGVTAVLLTLGVHRMRRWMDTRSSGDDDAHAAVVHLSLCCMSPGLLISGFHAYFRDSLIGCWSHLLFLVLALLVLLAIGISFDALYAGTLFAVYSAFTAMAVFSLRRRRRGLSL